MTYDRQYLDIDFGFAIGGTPEVAHTGVKYSTVTGWTGAVAALAEIEANETACLTAVAAAMTTLMNDGSVAWADYSDFVSVKVAAIGTNGLYLTDPLVFEAAIDSGASSNVLPQSSIVLSLRSGFTLGKANYGRMYLPHTRSTLTAGGPFVASGDTDGIADAGAQFLNDVTTALTAEVTAVIFPVILSSIGSGFGRGVTEVKVGNVIDTQRRRRRQLAETYSTTSL